MVKKILAIVITAVLSFAAVSAFAEEPSEITAVDGTVTISVATEAEEGTPVLIFIMPAIVEDDVDVTADRVNGLTSKEALSTLDIEYASIVNADENGLVSHICVMKDSLATGDCHVVFSYLGSEGCYLAGTFEHVGKDDMKSLVSAFNLAASDTCASIIDEDMNGKDGAPAKEILRKSSADVAYYASLEDKTEFHSLLYTLNGNEDFTLSTLVAAFNEAGVWIRLRSESDTLKVLGAYNGEDSYWNVDIGEDSDFANLSDTEKTNLLSAIKLAKFEDKKSLEDSFLNGVALAMFRQAEIREDIEALISEDGKYAEIFAKVRKIISNSELNEYNTALMYTDILNLSGTCTALEDIEALFENTASDYRDDDEESEDEEEVSRPMTGTAGYTGGGSSNKFTKEDNSGKVVTAFSDVSLGHWAKEYIEKLYTKGVINGTGNNAFSPESRVQKQDFVKILIGALDISSSNNPSIFADCPDGAYYTPYVIAAYKKGLVQGVDDAHFGAGVNIKREDAAVIIDRVLSMYNYEIPEKEIKFSDEDNIAGYAKEAVARAAKAGIFSGNEQGNFNPKSALSRAEACAILCRLAEKVKGV